MNWVGMKTDQGPVKSPRTPLYKRGKTLKWFQQVPPFHKGGFGGIRKQQEGYSLVEVLIAITVLAFGLMAVATMQVTAIKTNATASGISQGLTLAQTKVEELMNLSYDHPDLDDDGGGINNGTGQDLDDDGVDDDGDNFGLDDTTGADGSEAIGSRYTIYWNIAVDEPVTKSKTIRVIVTWTERGRDKRIALDFVKTDLS
jgi:type IV pilus assembly protein PilV